MTGSCSDCGEEEPPREREPEPPPLAHRIDDALGRAARFVVSKQRDDGSFDSGTYAAFRDGRAVSPMALMALWAAPRHGRLDRAYRRGVDFVARGQADVSTYPVYTLAASILVFTMPRNERHRARIEPFAAALRALQQEDGGWGYLGLPSNLSTTLFAAGALRLAGDAPDSPAMVRARAFVERCQNFSADPDPRFDDGGFFFSPDFADGNKAGPAGQDAAGRTRFRSYGSMTADGLRLLVRFGAPPSDPRVTAARAWLRAHFSATSNPGEFGATDVVRGESTFFYYAWSVAHAMRAVGERDFAAPLAEELLRRQGEDGAWRNRYTEMREDDPLVATPFAMAALAVTRTVLTGEPRSHLTER